MRAACVVRGNGLAEVRLLARGLREHHPDWPLTVLVAPGARPDVPPEPGVTLLRPADLGDAALDAALPLARADALDACLRPLLVRHLIAAGEDVVLLPPDGDVRAPLAELIAAEGDVVAVPRLAGRLPEDGERPGWRDLLAAGELDDELVLVRAGARGPRDRRLVGGAGARARPGEHPGVRAGAGRRRRAARAGA